MANIEAPRPIRGTEPNPGRQHGGTRSEPIPVFDAGKKGPSPCDLKAVLIKNAGPDPRTAVTSVRGDLDAINTASAEADIAQMAQAGAELNARRRRKNTSGVEITRNTLKNVRRRIKAHLQNGEPVPEDLLHKEIELQERLDNHVRKLGNL